MSRAISTVQVFAERVITNIERVIVGKRDAVELAVIGLLCQGHLLIEDVPGVGKTVLARSLARSLGCSFSRIQFTPDMLPSDVTGQAAMLEAMEERQVTVDGATHPLPRPFMVLATQNPIEYEGTFPLPEAQLDRFLLRIWLGYPAMSDEIVVLKRQQFRHPIEDLEQVASVEELTEAQEAVKTVHVAEPVMEYMVKLTRRTRQHSEAYLGASPRGSLALYRAGQTRAAILGRDYVLPDDIKVLALPALAHRVIPGPAARLRDVTADRIVQGVVEQVAVPGGDFTGEE